MANYPGPRLVTGELWSTKFPGFIDKGNGTYRKPREWVNKSGVKKYVNSYYSLVSCCVCNREMLQDNANLKKGNKSTCGEKCLSALRSKEDGTRKFKRSTSDSHVLIKSSSHPGKNKDGYVPEHRLMVEKSLGRLLSKSEIVHHINLLKSDNRIENLVVFESDKEHFLSHGSLNKCVSKLMEMGVLVFNRETKTYEVVC